jgi:hypothetical protein
LAIPTLLRRLTDVKARCLARSEERLLFPFPNCTMKRWIAKLFGGSQEQPRYVEEFLHDDLRVCLLAEPRDCGHAGYVVHLYLRDDRDDTWVQIGCVADVYLQTATILLQRAMESVAKLTGMRELPTVHVRGRTYFVDDRLHELRDVDNPHDRAPLELVPSDL